MASLWEILIPRYSNAKEEYPLSHHREWDSRVREIANGLTILKSTKGHWVDPSGTVLVEEMIPVRISCTREQLDSILSHTLDHYDQEAVMAYEVSQNVIIKHRERGAGR